MLKEYIAELMSSNQAELEKLNGQLKHLMEEQKNVQNQIGSLQREQSLDRNIFSPRRHVSSYYEKIEIAQEQLRETERKIERTRELMEAQMKKKEECDKLLEETERMAQENNETAASSEAELTEKAACEPEIVQNNSKDNNLDNDLCETEPVIQDSPTEIKTQQPAASDIAESIRAAADQQALRMQENIAQEKLHAQTERLKELLTDLYQKNEVCMALLNGDKNRCRNEMRSMKKMIKQYAEEMF